MNLSNGTGVPQWLFEMLSTPEAACVSQFRKAAKRAWNCRKLHKRDGEQACLYSRPYPRQPQAAPVEASTKLPRTPPHQRRGRCCHFQQLCSHDTGENQTL